jgi:hypothetical protein
MKAKYPLGTTRVPKPKAYRLVSYLRALGWVVAGAAVAIGLLSLVQIFFHPFDELIATAESGLSAADKALQADAFSGISLGTIALVAAFAALSLFKKGVSKRQYGLSFWRGLLSSAIFLATDRLYRFVQGLGVLYFSATLALFVAATIVLVEIVSRAGRQEAESETRTELLASIVSGLVFGLLVQLAERLLRIG